MTKNTEPVAATPQSFDLSSLAEAMHDTAVLTVTHPRTGAPTPITITLAAPDSETYRAVDRRVKNRNMATARKSRNGLTIEAIEAGMLDLIVGVTLDWDGVTWDGAPLKFSADNARMVYAKFPFIREQVDEFLAERVNFFSD